MSSYSWGQYLANGVSCNTNNNKSNGGNNSSEDLILRFEKRIETALKSEGLSQFSSVIAVGFLKKKLASKDGGTLLARAIQYILWLINDNAVTRIQPVISSSGIDTTQSGCPNVIPGLRARPFWDDTSCFSWVSILESNYSTIREEFMSLKGYYTDKSSDNDEHEQVHDHMDKHEHEKGPFQHYRSPVNTASKSKGGSSADHLGALSTDKGDWNVCYLFLHGLDFEDNLAKCPKTAAIIKSISRHYHHCFFSALAADTHIMPHFGPTNKKLRCHLPIFVPPPDGNGKGNNPNPNPNNDKKSAAWLRVADQTRYLHEGKCVVFDDSFRHESANESKTHPRIVLIIDIWHPDLTDEEIHFLKFITNAQVKAAQKMAQLRATQEVVPTQVGVGDTVDISNIRNGSDADGKSSGNISGNGSGSDISNGGSSNDGSSNDGSNSGNKSMSDALEVVHQDFFSVIKNSRKEGITSTDISNIWGEERLPK